MKNILHHLYQGDFHESARNTKEFSHTAEFLNRDKAYEALEKTFTEQQYELFDEYFLADGGCLGLLLERAYKDGFQTGFWLAMELIDFQV